MSSSSSSSGVVSGRDIAPSAFDISIPGCDDPDKNDDLAYDLHHLVAVDSQPVDEDIKSVSTIERDQILFASARDNAQLLFNRIFALDKKDSDTGLLAVLPDIDTNDVGSIDAILPRFRPVPKVKAETRWEKFAKEKGIVNRKRDRMVFDERSQTLKPRYGYGRANDDTKDWAIPVGANDDPYEDPFAKRDMEKKERVLKNQLKQMANVDRSLGLKTSHGLKSNLVGRNDKNARRKGGPSSDGAGGPAKKRARHGMGSDFVSWFLFLLLLLLLLLLFCFVSCWSYSIVSAVTLTRTLFLWLSSLSLSVSLSLSLSLCLSLSLSLSVSLFLFLSFSLSLSLPLVSFTTHRPRRRWWMHKGVTRRWDDLEN